MTEWINGVKIGATPDAKISLRIPDLSIEGCVTLREARMMEDGLAAAISACILPNQAFRWEAPTLSYKESARLLCEDQQYIPRLRSTPHPRLSNIVLSPSPGWVKDAADLKYQRLNHLLYETVEGDAAFTGTIAGFVLQQNENLGGTDDIPQGYYIAAASPDWDQKGFPDFEDAQASVAARLRAQGIS